MKYFNKPESIKRHFTRSLRYIAIAIIFSTIEAHGVIGGNTYEDIFTRDIYDVSEAAQSKFRQARMQDVNEKDRQLASLAHEAARVYEEGSKDYLAVATLYYQKFQCVHARLTSFLKNDRDFLEGIKNQLTQFHEEKADWGKVSNVLKNLSMWVASTLAHPASEIAVGLNFLGLLALDKGSEELDLNRDVREIGKVIREIDKKIAQAEEGVVNEPIKYIEETYVKQKIIGENFISSDLQNTIEGNLINSRKPLYPFPWVKKSLENSLKLPHTYKVLKEEKMNGFKKDKFFQRYPSETCSQLEDLATDIISSSQDSEDSKVSLRSVCYVHGKPGIGKTEAVKHLAEFFDLPVAKLNIRSIQDLSSSNLEGVDALNPGATAGWFSSALLSTDAEGKTYLNAVLILDEFDRILLDPNSGVTGLAFFLDFLDPTKRSFYSPYFNAEIDISRMHIFVTGNSEIPDTPEYQALRERFTQTIAFEPMENDYRKEVLKDYLIELGKRYKISEEVLSIQSNYLIDGAITLAKDPSSLRECKQQLQNIVRDFRTGGRLKVHERIQTRAKKELEKSE